MFFKKNRAKILASVTALAFLLGVGSYELLAQPSAPFYFPITGHAQNSLRYNDLFTPQRIEGGCESEKTGSGSVNGWRLSGGTVGNPVTITAFPCTGGDTNIGISIVAAGTGAVSFTGTGAITTQRTFRTAIDSCRSDNALLIPVRVAANDFALARTAAGAETYNVNCTIQLPYQLVANKGARIDSIEISYQILTAALTTHTFTNMVTRTFGNNAANVIAQLNGAPTVTLNTATQANPYFAAVTFAAPVFMNSDNTEVNVEWQAVMQNTGVYRVYGVMINWSQALY